jgi:hypothetical protein
MIAPSTISAPATSPPPVIMASVRPETSRQDAMSPLEEKVRFF